MIREQSSQVSGLPAACHIIVGDVCVYVREMKELFRLILREPPDSDLLLWEVRLMRAYSHLAFSSGQELKGSFPRIKSSSKLPSTDKDDQLLPWTSFDNEIILHNEIFKECYKGMDVIVVL